MTTPRGSSPGKLAIAVVLAGSPMIALVFTVVAPLLPQMAAYLGGPHGDGALMAQMIMTIASVGLVVGGPVTGFLYTSLGGWRLMALLLLAFALDGVLGIGLSSAWAFLASRALLGFLAGGIQMCCYTLVAEMASGAKRARLIGYQVAAGSGTAVLGLLAAGFIAAAWGWRTAFALYLLALPLAAAALVASSPAAHGAASGGEDGDAGGESALSLWPIYVLVALAAIPLNMPSVQISFELASDGTSNPAMISLVIASFSLALVVGSGTYGRMRQRWGGEVIPVLALLLLGAGFVCIGSTRRVELVIAGCLLGGLGAGLLNPHFSVVVLERVSMTARSRAVGFLSGSFFAGDLLNPIAILPLRNLAGIHACFQLVGAALALLGLAWQLARRRRRTAPLRA